MAHQANCMGGSMQVLHKAQCQVSHNGGAVAGAGRPQWDPIKPPWWWYMCSVPRVACPWPSVWGLQGGAARAGQHPRLVWPPWVVHPKQQVLEGPSGVHYRPPGDGVSAGCYQ